MATIVKRPAAERDLEDLAVFIGQSRPASAVRFLDAAERTFGLLAVMPGMGAPFSVANPRLADLRHHPIQGFRNYIAFYLPTADGIEVVRVLRGGRDIQTVLTGEP